MKNSVTPLAMFLPVVFALLMWAGFHEKKLRRLERKQEALQNEQDRLETGQKMLWLQSHIDYTITNDGGRLMLVLPSNNTGAIGSYITNTRPNTIMVELPANKTPVPLKR